MDQYYYIIPYEDYVIGRRVSALRVRIQVADICLFKDLCESEDYIFLDELAHRLNEGWERQRENLYASGIMDELFGNKNIYLECLRKDDVNAH